MLQVTGASECGGGFRTWIYHELRDARAKSSFYFHLPLWYITLFCMLRVLQLAPANECGGGFRVRIYYELREAREESSFYSHLLQ